MGEGPPRPEDPEIARTNLFCTVLWGRAPPRPEAKTPRPSTLARISRSTQPGAWWTKEVLQQDASRLQRRAHPHPQPELQHPTLADSTARADTHTHTRQFDVVCWRLAWTTTRALLGTMRTHACVVDCCQCTCDARRLRICCQGAECSP